MQVETAESRLIRTAFRCINTARTNSCEKLPTPGWYLPGGGVSWSLEFGIPPMELDLASLCGIGKPTPQWNEILKKTIM